MKLTDEEANHLASLRELTAPGGPISPVAPTATHLTRPPGARMKLHARILSDFFAEKEDVLRDRRALVTAGPPGAGKTYARRQQIPEADEPHWRFIDPDDFKTRLLKHALESGEYDAIVPDDARRRMEAGERFAPGEFAALVHEESSELAGVALQRSLHRGERVVIDGVHGSKDKIFKRFEELERNGYGSVQIVCVDGPKDVTRERVISRWRHGYAAAADAEDTDAGYQARYVPEDVTEAVYDREESHSTCSAAVVAATKYAPRSLNVEAELYYVDNPAAAGRPWQSLKNDHGHFTRDNHQRIRPPRTPQPTPPAAQEQDHPGDDAETGASNADGTVQVDGYMRGDTWVSGYSRNRPQHS